MRVTCKCRTCKTNATKLGLDKLEADAPEAVAAEWSRHAIVHQAFDPSVLGESVRDRAGIAPVGYTHTRVDRPTSLADAKARAQAIIASKHA